MWILRGGSGGGGRPVYEDRTEGIRVQVRPDFSLAQSAPDEGRFVFSYRVHLENLGEEPGQLLYRHWDIHDSVGEHSEVDGEGVIGEQPFLAPGGSHTYQSFCVLKSPSGYMEGHYTFTRSDGSHFRVRIPRFELAAPLPPPDVGGIRSAGIMN
jgi:ApaG protein